MRVPFCENETVVNLTENEAPILQTALLEAIKSHNAEIGRLDERGQRYTIDFEFERQGKRITIRSARIIDSEPEIPRLIMCFPLRN